MLNSNYKDTHGIVIQGNSIQVKETEEITRKEQVDFVVKQLDEYFSRLTASSCPSLDCKYVITFFNKDGDYADEPRQLVLNYYKKLLAAIKRISNL